MAELQNRCNSKIMSRIKKEKRPVIHFESYKGQAVKTCAKYSKRYQIEFDELFNECFLIFVNAINTFNAYKAKFSTYYHHQLESGIKRYIKRLNVGNYVEYNGNEASQTANPEHNAIFMDLLEQISSEAKEVVKLCLDMPKEMVWIGAAKDYKGERKYAVSKHTVANYLRSKRWETTTINKCFAEIANIF